jgi:hypothetical protein
MAFVVARPQGRFEIRESQLTPKGPRARTLASFRVLNTDVLAEASNRAHQYLDERAIRRRCEELGPPVADESAAHDARRLIAALRRGGKVGAPLAALLRRELPAGEVVPDTVDGASEWIGRSAFERGRTLVDLLRLASMLPQRKRPDEIAFPRIDSSAFG